MRFAVLGPAHDDLVALEKGANLVLFELEAEEVIYLGADDALDRLVWDWARRLVGPDPSEEGLWDRAAQRCGPGSPDAIDRFIASEGRRARLKALKCLPAATSRTVEILEGRVAVLLYDKALLDEEDIMPASFLIFGKSRDPIVRQVGSRTFISPGELGAGPAGIALLSGDENGDVTVSIYDPAGGLLESQVIPNTKTGKFTVLEKVPVAGERT
jgi:hypothetical protein